MKIYPRTPFVHLAIAALALVFFLTVGPAELQAQGRGMMGGGQLMSSLLIMEEVQQELELSDEQIEKISGPASEIVDNMQAEMRDIMMGGGDMEEVAEMVRGYRDEEKPLLEHLNDDQNERIRQLRFQQMGVRMFQEDEVQESLDISEEQVEEIENVMGSLRDRIMEASMDARESGDRAAFMEAIQKVQEEMTTEVHALLTDKQKQQAVELTGEKFEFPQSQRRGGRRSDF